MIILRTKTYAAPIGPLKLASQAFVKATQQGAKTTGILGGIKNTWNNGGLMTKGAMVAGGTGLAYTSGKGMFGGSGKNQQQQPSVAAY